MRGVNVVASAKVECHGLTASRLQACAKGRLETVKRLTAALKELGKFRITIQGSAQLIILERSRAREGFVWPHPGINQQPAGRALGGIAKIILQDAIGVSDARRVGVRSVQPAHLFVQRHKQTPNDKGVWRKTGANLTQQAAVAGVKQNDRWFD